MIRYTVLGSGSSGNSYIISSEGFSILFDAGYPLKTIKGRSVQAGIPFESVQALFITHLHPDHARGAGVFARRTALPVYVNANLVLSPCAELDSLGIPGTCLRTFVPGTPVSLGPFSITAFPTSHDSPCSVGYCIGVDGRYFLLLTDTGKVTDEMRTYARISDVLFLEANYEQHLLETGPYPYYLKRRIAGESGHLSNNDAISFLNDCRNEAKSHRHVYFCHLSNTNNTPEILAADARDSLDWDGDLTICAKGSLYSGCLA